MSSAIRILAVVCLLFTWLEARLAHADELTDSDKEVIAWFDSLSFVDFVHAKFVRVTIRDWLQVGDKPLADRSILAFLLNETENSFSVFTLELQTRTFTKKPANTENQETAAFALVDLGEIANLELKRLSGPISDDVWRRFGESISERVEIFTLGRGCAAQGLDGLAHRLIAAAAALPDRRTGMPLDSKGLRPALAAEISYAMMWRAVVNFGEPSISRQELLANFRLFLKRFPESEYVKRAQETADLLATMVEEDTQHASEKRKLAEPTTKSERVAELIFQLRDQNGRQFSQPGSCDIFDDPRGEASPATQLRDIGFDAVPQLLKFVDDPRFTRSVGFHRGFYFSHHVLRVGDCAKSIIEEIAGRSFSLRATPKDGKVGAFEQQVQQWWDEVQAKGEKQVLIEAVMRVDDNTASQARRLVEKYPEAALDALRLGIAAGRESWVRTQLVELAGQLKDDAVLELLLAELRNAPKLSTRLSAAKGLLARNRPEPIAAMIEQWRELGKRSLESDESEVGAFLARCEKPEAIKVLTDGLIRRSVNVRFDVIWAIPYHLSTGSAVGIDLTAKQHVSTPELEAAVEALLISSLTDTEERIGLSVSSDEVSFQNPRISDVAGYVLSRRFKDKYQFDYSAVWHERNRQLVLLQNIWRKEHDLAALPLPPPRTNAGLPAQDTQPLLAKIAAASTPMDREQSVLDLERLGIGALPAVRVFHDALATDHPARPQLSALASRLANIVMETDLQPISASSDNTLTQRLATVKGKSLSAAMFVHLLTDTARRLPKGATGLTLSTYRYDDNTGVRLTLVLHQDFVQGGSQKGWQTYESVDVGVDNIKNSTGSSSYEYRLKIDSYDDLFKAIEQALAAPPSVTFHIRASLKLDR